MIIEMRPGHFAYGLIELTDYINQFYPTKEMNMIEIGCYAGESTMIFSNFFKNVITIDPLEPNYHSNDTASNSDFNAVYSKFLKRTLYKNNIKHIKLKSDDAYLIIDNKVDFVYIDGMHTYDQVKKDILNYGILINENGFIGGHDYVDGWAEVKRAVDETIGNVDMVFSDFSWIKKL